MREYALLRFIMKLLGLVNSTKPNEHKKELYGLDNLDDDVIGYPPSPRGIPVVQNQVVLHKMMPQINTIKSQLGLSYKEFDEIVLPVLFNWIDYADLLPASEYDHHSTGGGLIYHSFDVAIRAMNRAQITQFPKGLGTIADTQNSNFHWKTATVLAALLHDGGKVLADMVVTDGHAEIEKEIVWDAHDELSLTEWAKRNNIERYFIRWNKQRHLKHQNASLMIMQRLIPQKTWSWIDSCYDGKFIHSAMLNAVAKSSIDHPMSRIIAESDSDSVREDRYHRNSHITKETKRIPLSSLMADSIKHKILIGHFKINRKGAKVWFVDNKLYLLWNSIAPEVISEISDAGYSIPDVPDVLARFMYDDGLAHCNGDAIYFPIYPEILGDKSKPVKLDGLKITNIERFIHEPSKLYSIKEHEVKKFKAEAYSIIEENDEDEKSEYTGRKQKIFESSIETISRVLGLMQRKKSATVQIEQAPNTTELPGAELEHNTTVQDEHPEIKHQRRYDDLGELAAFLQSKFDLNVKDGKVVLPKQLLSNAEDEVVAAKINGINEFNCLSAIKSDKEVAIQ